MYVVLCLLALGLFLAYFLQTGCLPLCLLVSFGALLGLLLLLAHLWFVFLFLRDFECFLGLIFLAFEVFWTVFFNVESFVVGRSELFEVFLRVEIDKSLAVT